MSPSSPAPSDRGVLAVPHSLIDGSPAPMAELEGAAHRVRYVNPAFCRLAGKSREALVGEPFAEAIPADDTCLAVMARVLRTGEAETHTDPEPSGSGPAFRTYTMWPVLDADERPAGLMMQVTETAHFHRRIAAMNEALLVASVRQHEQMEAAETLNERLQIEIRERRRAEDRQELLLSELAHRGNNLLAVMQSIVSRSLAGDAVFAEARTAILQRIQALARSQAMLARGAFEGASLAEIARLELEGFSDRVTAIGPDLTLNPGAAETFALLVHELATNATKHGALSRPHGEVTVTWSIDHANTEAVFRFSWQERGGPPAVQPTRQGFGRTLIEQVAAREFGSAPRISYAPEGFSYEIDAPLSAVSAGAD